MGNSTSCLVVDVGGSNTRFLRMQDIQKPPDVQEAIRTHPVRSKEAFRRAVEKNLAAMSEKPQSAVVAMAGIVNDHRSGMMTNWEEQTNLNLEELCSWGLPEETILANDLEAAAYAIDPIAFDDHRERTTYLNANRPARYRNSVVIAPGTGFGMAVLVYTDSTVPVVLTSEAQHCPAGSFYKRHIDIIRSFEEQQNEAPSWEDLVSGRGLEFLYSYNTGRKSEASRIAERANTGDAGAQMAVCDYYNVAAEAAQTLALLVRPAGGVYLCGDTTVKNKELIMRSGFVTRFCDNPVHEQTLATYPLVILDIENVVVHGAIRMGQLLL